MAQQSIKLTGVDRILGKLDAMSRETEKALVSTLNSLGSQAVTAANKGIREEYNIKAGDVKKAVQLVRARSGGAQGKGKRYFVLITAQGGRLGLFKFGGRPTEPPLQKGVPVSKRRPVTVQISKKGGRRQVTRDAGTGNMPFVAKMTTAFGRGGFLGGNRQDMGDAGHTGIFVRTPKWRGEGRARHQVIRELRSIGVAEMFARRGGDAMRKLVSEKGLAMIERNLAFFRGKLKKGA